MKVTLSDRAKKQLKQLDKTVQKRIIKFLSETVRMASPCFRVFLRKTREGAITG